MKRWTQTSIPKLFFLIVCLFSSYTNSYAAEPKKLDCTLLPDKVQCEALAKILKERRDEILKEKVDAPDDYPKQTRWARRDDPAGYENDLHNQAYQIGAGLDALGVPPEDWEERRIQGFATAYDPAELLLLEATLLALAPEIAAIAAGATVAAGLVATLVYAYNHLAVPLVSQLNRSSDQKERIRDAFSTLRLALNSTSKTISSQLEPCHCSADGTVSSGVTISEKGWYKVQGQAVPKPKVRTREACKNSKGECCNDFINFLALTRASAEKITVEKGSGAYRVLDSARKLLCCLEMDLTHGGFEIFSKDKRHVGEVACEDLSRSPCERSTAKDGWTGQHYLPDSKDHKPRKGCLQI